MSRSFKRAYHKDVRIKGSNTVGGNNQLLFMLLRRKWGSAEVSITPSTNFYFNVAQLN